MWNLEKSFVVALFSTTMVFVACLAVQAQTEFPPIPAAGELVQDYAKLISEADLQAIRKIQLTAYEKYDTPIVVVTITSKATFRDPAMGIERIAHDLFNHWQIGKRDERGRLINQGILLLVSVGDRKARIELGDDWRRDWDDHANDIMQSAIVPNFKKGDFSAGILAGLEKLSRMARSRPDGSVPFSIADSLGEPMMNGFNPMPRWLGVSLIMLGIGLIVFGVQNSNFQKPLIIAGFVCILFGFLYFAIIWAIALLGGMNSLNQDGISGGSSGGGWDAGGGFSSGGFSGGGGATGSW